MMLLPSLAILCLNASPSFAITEGRKVPVEIEIPAARLAEMSETERAALDTLRRSLIDNVWMWDDLRIEPPASVFTDNAVALDSTDLFAKPDESGEIEALAHDADGQRKRLSPAQYDHMRQYGEIVVPSQRFPGRNHVWKMTWIAQVGRENIRISLEKTKDRAAEQLFVQLPARWRRGEFISAAEGAARLGRGVRGLLAATVGVIERVPRYTDEQIEAKVADAADRHLRLAAPDLDLRLYDADLMAKAQPLLNDLTRAFDNEWPALERRFLEEILPPLRAQGMSGEVLAQVAQYKLRLKRASEFLEKVKANGPLQRLSPGLPALLADRERAVALTQQAEADVEADVRAFADTWRADFRRNHPRRARATRVIERRLKDPLAAHRLAVRRRRAEALVTELTNAGLAQEAQILAANIAFYFDEAERVRAERRRIEMPERSVSLRSPYLSAKDWVPQPHTEKDNTVTFTPLKHHERTVTSDTPGWRARLFASRANQSFWTINHAVVIENLINGPFGVRALFNAEPFFPARVMNPQTAQIEFDRTKPRATFMSQHRLIWAGVDERLGDFENEPDRGIVRKSMKRPFAYAIGYARGIAHSTLLNAVQGGLTTLNVPLSLACAVTSPALAFAYASACDMFDLTIGDTTSVKRGREPYPLIADGVARPAVGVAEIIGAASASLGHVIAAPALYAGGLTSAKVKKMKDDYVDRRFKLSSANVPVQDERLMLKRKSGPSVEANHTFQIRPDVVLTVLQAELEELELDVFAKRVDAMLREPATNARQQTERLFGALVSAEPQRWINRITENTREAVTNTQRKLDARRARMPKLAADKRRVRLADDELGPTLDAAERLTEAFWQRSEEKFEWITRGVAKGDYRALAKVLLNKRFGATFTEPADPADDTFVIEVTSPDLNAVVDAVTSGTDIDIAKLEGGNVVTPVRQVAADVDPRLRNPDPLGQGFRRPPCAFILKR